jgi:hypothetical protein
VPPAQDYPSLLPRDNTQPHTAKRDLYEKPCPIPSRRIEQIQWLLTLLSLYQ